MNVTFEPNEDGSGIEVVDVVQRHRYTLATPDPVTAVPADPRRMLFPVDEAIELTTSEIELLDAPCVYVRDADGQMVATTEPPSRRDLPEGDYYVEICAPIKLYLRVSAPISVESSLDGKSIEFGGETTVLLGGRSKHDRPAGTVTTTEDPRDVMAAVSSFGSALKTTSPERSFPTLRGHPPTVERGDELDVPADLAPPETGVRIEVPPDYRHVYVVSTLSYYLGATVVPGERPRLLTDAGFSYDLGPDFEREVERVLKGTFLLDCVTRTEGFYDVALAERRAVEPLVDLDFARLYDRPLADRLEAYLAVPYGKLEPHVPEWKLTTHVDATPATVETLPFVVDDLAVVRTDAATVPDGVEATPSHEAAVDSFVRGGSTRGQRSASAAGGGVEPTVAPTATGSMEQTWVGEGIPFGASKATAEAYHNRIDRGPGDGEIEVTVVCNDARMAEERQHLDDVYGSREELPFAVRTYEGLTVAELREVLAGETAFLHYIGHIDDGGFECVDGSLDAATVEETGVEAFLLNACQSYHQGMALIDAGSIGGIVTLEEVVNSGAVDVGYTLGRLLNNGFPLSPAMNIAREGSYIGQQYLVLGDGGFAFVQSEHGVPNVCEVERLGDGFEVEMVTYASSTHQLGAFTKLYVEESNEYYLHSGPLESFTFEEWDDALEFLRRNNNPSKVDDELYWNEDLEELRFDDGR